MNVLIIGGHHSSGHEDSLHHCDDFRLTVDNVPMSIPNLVTYFKNGRTLPDGAGLLAVENRRPRRQIYLSGIHIWSMLIENGYEADILNCHDPDDKARLKFYEQSPQCVVISTTFMNIQAVRKVAQDVRKHLPDAWIVAGGVFVRYSYLIGQRQNEPWYNLPQVLDDHLFTCSEPIREIDAYIFDPHGEKTLLAMLEKIKTGKRPRKLPNTIVPDSENGWTINAEKPEKFNFNDYRIQWENLPRRRISMVVPLAGSYGCPFRCGFCNFSNSKFTRKSADTIFQELRAISDTHPIERVWFTDDNFLLTPEAVEEFCTRYIEQDLPFSWMTFIRANSITERTAPLLRKSNCCLGVLGLESASPEILSNMNKKDTVENYAKAVRLLVENGVDTEISFIFGYPGECERTVNETLEFINSIPTNPQQVNYLYLFKFSLVPLSPVFEAKSRQQYSLVGANNDWRHNTMSSDEVFGHMKTVASSVNTTVFNYIDPAGKLSRRDLKSIMVLREDLARMQLRTAPERNIAQQWNEIERAFRSHQLI